MFSWIQVDPMDDLWQVAEGEVDGDPVDVKRFVDEVESDLSMNVTRRLIDPNMGRSPTARRTITWQDEFDAVGLNTDLADDAFESGATRVNQLLRPDSKTRRPRLRVASCCPNTIKQMKRYQWEDWKLAAEKAQKQKPKTKDDDFPTLWRYMMNLDADGPRFQSLQRGHVVIRRMGQPHGKYTPVGQRKQQAAVRW
jgi:hypothetical protein